MRRLAWSTTVVTGAMAAVSVAFAFADDGTRLPPGEGATVSAPRSSCSASWSSPSRRSARCWRRGSRATPSAGCCAWRRSRSRCPGSPTAGTCTRLRRPGLAAAARRAAVGRELDLGVRLHAADHRAAAAVPGRTPAVAALVAGRRAGRSRRSLCLFAGYAFAPGALEDYRRVENPLGVDGGLLARAAHRRLPAHGRRGDRVRGRARGPLPPLARGRAPAAQVDGGRRRARGRRLAGSTRCSTRSFGVQSSVRAAAGAARAARRRDRRDPALPPLRPRRGSQPHAGLPRADRHARRRLPRARARDRAHARHLERGDRDLDAGRRRALPARCARASRPRSTAASTAAATTRSARSTRSARACATRSTSTASARTSTPRCWRRCSPRTCRCG